MKPELRSAENSCRTLETPADSVPSVLPDDLDLLTINFSVSSNRCFNDRIWVSVYCHMSPPAWASLIFNTNRCAAMFDAEHSLSVCDQRADLGRLEGISFLIG